MSEYNGCYVKLADHPAYWAVDGGERRIVHSQAEMLRVGVRRVVTVSQEEMDAIPVAGQQRQAPRSVRKKEPEPPKKDDAEDE